MQKERRHFLLSTVGGAAALAMQPFLVKPVFSSTVFPVGGSSLNVLSDGNLVLPGDFVTPAGYPDEKIAELLDSNSQPDGTYQPACNISLWRTADKLVLFDVGAGSNFMPSTGELLANLEEAGIDPSDITDVVFTHAHPDHLWGLVDDFDELAFPDANYHMNAAEWDYWRAADTIDKLPESRKTFAVGAQNRMAYLEDRINLFQFGAEVVSGVEAVNTAGHTPGHTSFALHDGNESVMVLGDAITHSKISFQKYDWPSASDQDQELGRRTRGKLLDRLAADKMQLLGYHLPHPGLGRAEKMNSAYRFVAE